MVRVDPLCHRFGPVLTLVLPLRGKSARIPLTRSSTA
jgi:hypothetical protein